MGGLKSSALPTAADIGDGDSSALATGGSFGGGFDQPSAAPNTPSPNFRSSPLDGGGLLDGLSSRRLALSAPVGPGAANRPGDVTRMQQVLAGAEIPVGRIDGVFGKKTGDAIATAQARLNQDHPAHVGRTPLKVDGLVNPKGPTQAATRGLAGQVAEARRIADQARTRREAPKPAPRPAAGTPASPLAPKTNAPPLSPPKPSLQDRVAAMPGDDFQTLRRLAGGLRKTTKPGPVAGDIAGAFRADPEAAAAEFSVIREALEKSGTPEQVENLDKAVPADNADSGCRPPFRDFLLWRGEEARPEILKLDISREEDPRANVPLAEKAAEGGQGGLSKGDAQTVIERELG